MKLDFERNLGSIDRFIRLLIAIILLSLAPLQIAKGWWTVIANILALSQFIEAALAY